MKIAIVAPSHVPFLVGGAENLWWGLLRAINAKGADIAELIKLPSPEYDFWDLLRSYRQFSNLDLSHFDCVLTTKYPAWMVAHPRHICYIQHKLRGLYDTYPLSRLGSEYKSSTKSVSDILSLIRKNSGEREVLDELFERLDHLAEDPDVEEDVFAFPGPFIREVIHFLDGVGLSQKAIYRYCAISENVCKREHYFPSGVSVDVHYHPSSLPYYKKGDYRYFFTASRLEKSKRIDLIIEAMQHIQAPVDLIIAGTGPDRQRLEKMAAHDSRIRFVGYVSEKDLIGYYSDALCIIYVPYDEDYGLITIEAMMSEKPVITVDDSGGPNEIVKDGENGFCVPPNPVEIAEKMQLLYKNPDRAVAMGKNAGEHARKITWEQTVARLFDTGPGTLPGRKKETPGLNITVASTFSIYPPLGGGQHRIFHLYKKLACNHNVEIVTLGRSCDSQKIFNLSKTLKEIRVPKSQRHCHEEYHAYEAAVGQSVTDVCFPVLSHLTPDYRTALAASAGAADLVIASHPYTHRMLQEICQDNIVYEAHNVEYDLKRSILPDNETGRKLLDLVKRIEGSCCKYSKAVLACSEDVKNRLAELYAIDSDKIFVVPNGVDLNSVSFCSIEERLEVKRRLKLEHHSVALFMGSYHAPNIEALRHIIQFAQDLPDMLFFIVGSCCNCFTDTTLPQNVKLLGAVDNDTKNTILSFVDIALNPMTSGCGTNMKVLDYLAAGVPVVSTPFGIRGLNLSADMIGIAEIPQFTSRIVDTLNPTNESKNERIRGARSFVEKHFDWNNIAANVNEKLLQNIMKSA